MRSQSLCLTDMMSASSALQINLPVGCLMRTPNGCFPEYHTSADNLDFVSLFYLADSFNSGYQGSVHFRE